jgi:hypothetical protein
MMSMVQLGAYGSSGTRILLLPSISPNGWRQEKNCPILCNIQGAFKLRVTSESLFFLSERIRGRGPLWHIRSTESFTSRGFLITHNDAPQSGLFWTSDQHVAETSTWQHITHSTNIHTPGGIRTHDRSSRAVVDLSLTSRSHWDRHKTVTKELKTMLHQLSGKLSQVSNWPTTDRPHTTL